MSTSIGIHQVVPLIGNHNALQSNSILPNTRRRQNISLFSSLDTKFWGCIVLDAPGTTLAMAGGRKECPATGPAWPGLMWPACESRMASPLMLVLWQAWPPHWTAITIQNIALFSNGTTTLEYVPKNAENIVTLHNFLDKTQSWVPPTHVHHNHNMNPPTLSYTTPPWTLGIMKLTFSESSHS